jgi:4-amino-4-deoxy-L-arabinose transferase-like glycosyltransferase
VITLVLLAGLTFFAGLGRPAITDSDEAYYAQAAREMLDGGDWLTPRFNGEDRWNKPVLYYWLTAAAYALAGPTEWAARFWSAASGLGLVLLTWSIGRRLTGRADAAWLAGAIVATCFGYFALARSALPDLPLACFTTLTIWASLRATASAGLAPATRPGRWWGVAGLAAALGFLVKGPVALAVPGLVLVPAWWRERRLRLLVSPGAALAVAIFSLVGLPWYLVMGIEHGGAWMESFFIGDNLERFTSTRFNEPRPLWFYLPVVLGGLLPWTPYLALLLPRAAAGLVRGARTTSKADWLLACWTVMPLLFFTLSIGKQPRYVLPLLPPLAIAIARVLAREVHDPRPGSPGPASLRLATWATATLLAGVAALLLRARPLFVHPNPFDGWIAIAAIAALALAAAALAAIALSRSWPRVPGAVAGAGAVLLLAVQYTALAGGRPEPVERMAALLRAHRSADEPVAQYGVFVRNLVFYTGLRHQFLFDERGAADYLRSPSRVLLVVAAGDLARLEALSGVSTRRLGEVGYFNTAGLRARTLIDPDPSRDVATVLLVANR